MFTRKSSLYLFKFFFLDINECSDDEGLCPKPGVCVNTLGSFRCICPRGFKLDSSKSFCIDADECLDDSKCSQGCQNLVGGFRCGCPEGFVKHYYYNQCIDEDECQNFPCGPSGNCVNTRGSYRCGCPDGYQFDTSLQICIQVHNPVSNIEISNSNLVKWPPLIYINTTI